MSRILRRFAAGLVVFILLSSSPMLAAADSFNRVGAREDQNSVPVLFDLLVLRPAGFVLTAGGFVAYAIAAPWMAITRPTDMHRPFRTLVICPARYTWVDPLGRHPDRDCSFGSVSEG